MGRPALSATLTENGIENLRQIIVEERTVGRAPPKIKPAK
jgi:hypothetical protein